MLKGPNSVESGDIEIYSVKNKYGIEYVLGDTINYNINKVIGSPFKIDNFFINRDGILLARSSMDSSATFEDINTVYKVKAPIYTTTDGVEMLNGYVRKIYLLNKDLSKPLINEVVVNWNLTDKETADRYLTFTSEENRDKYIKENSKKPIFVSADGVEIYDENHNIYSIISIERNHFTESKAYETFCKNNLYKHFSTKEARQEYIDNNKPKYSLEDIRSSYDKAYGNTFKGLLESLKKLGK